MGQTDVQGPEAGRHRTSQRAGALKPGTSRGKRARWVVVGSLGASEPHLSSAVSVPRKGFKQMRAG